MNNLTWSERFTRLKNHFGWTHTQIGVMLGGSKRITEKLVGSNPQKMGYGFMFAIIVFERCMGLTSQEELLPPSLETDKNNPYFEN